MQTDRAIRRVVGSAGNQAAVARALKVSPQAVSVWVARGRAPARRALQLAELSGGAVTVQELLADASPQH